ncbi:hypothetical protein EZV62_023104 [Acer yangbiense]|uniref:Uncharacterized protein n=1 Tax=Acer yangbiense TaxID=1000413 RepID=A0A5C7H0R3_9ROSI|nr:hypothetical protein EZV62_023104 [Acer yangbiense]
MDAAELGYPVVVPRIMGSEGFGRATVNQVEVVAAGAGAAACDTSSRVSLLVNSCTTFLRQKDVTSTVNDSESASQDKLPETELLKHDNHLPCIQADDLSEQLQSRGSNFPSATSRSEVVQVQRKSGKVSRSSSGGSKRPRLAQLEDNMSSAGVDDVKDISDNVGFCPTKFNSLEKSQMARQKNSCSGRRSDKRNFKVPMKGKYDTFSIKAGLASFGSAAGGNNFFGLYGLKSDVNDVTNLVDGLSLKDLLDGSYDCPSLSKDKGNKAANKNENFLLSVRKVCTILPRSKPVQSPNYAEMDSGSNNNLLVPLTRSIVSSIIHWQMNHYTRRFGFHQESLELCSPDIKPGTPVNPLDFPLYQPIDIFERLALPPPKDLEALLLEATKPSASSRTNSDIRSGKQISRRPSLPQFPWSHTFNGHCRTNSDAVKLLTRSTCQGRWDRIESSAISHGTSTDCFTNLESLTYDQGLVPPSSSVSIPWHEWGSSLTSSKASLVNLVVKSSNYAGSFLNFTDLTQFASEHCPKVLAAAQTLCDMSTQSLRRNPNGSVKWSKKPSQKAMKARKSKSIEKPEELSSTERMSLLLASSDNHLRGGVNHTTPSKRPKLSTGENKKDFSHINGLRKGSINWSTPKSSRSSPNRSVRDLIAETRHSTSDILRQSCMMPPPATRVSDKASNTGWKIRRILELR